jgi:putative addiction module component (TIGR02574 family)
MTETIERIKQELVALPATDRAYLANFLIDSLDPEDDATLDPTWEAELKHRLQEVKSGLAVGAPADEVFARLQRKYSETS